MGGGRGAKREHGPTESHPSRSSKPNLPRDAKPLHLLRSLVDSSTPVGGRASAVPTTWSGQRKDEACILLLANPVGLQPPRRLQPWKLESTISGLRLSGQQAHHIRIAQTILRLPCQTCQPGPISALLTTLLLRRSIRRPYYLPDTDYLTHLGLEHTSRSTVHAPSLTLYA